MKKAKKKAQIKSTESKALALTPEYKETLKFKAWCRHFYDRRSKETYGNATQSALRVYNTEDYDTAASIGHQNLKKLQNLRLAISDQEGFGYADMMKIGFAKMMSGEFQDWEKMMVRLGYFEPDPEKPAPNGNGNTFTFNFGNIFQAMEQAGKERGLNQ